MLIGELAARSGASRRSIRYYEACGLLTCRRTGAGYRDYEHAAPDRVGLIRRLIAAGLSTALIAEVIGCIHDERVDLEPGTAERLERLDQRIADDLRTLRRQREAVGELLAGHLPDG